MTVYDLIEDYKANGKVKYFYVNNVHYNGSEVEYHGYGSHYLTNKDMKYIKNWIVYKYRVVGYYTKVLSIDYMFKNNYLRYQADKDNEAAAHNQIVVLNNLFDAEQEQLYKQYNMFGGMD